MAETNRPFLSVIMTAHDEAEALERNLPLFLAQQGQHTCEVIVVDDASSDDTPDVLKRLKAQYPQLYTTFIPKSVPNPCRQRLALTIGAKAAKGEWIAVTSILRPPHTEGALEGMVQLANNQGEQVAMLYSGRKEGTMTVFQSWATLDDAAPLLRKAERRSGKGHRGRWFKRWRGLYDTVAVRRDDIHNLLKFYEQKISGRRLTGLRLHVLWKTLQNN